MPRQEWKTRGINSPGGAQRFVSIQAATGKICTIPRHLSAARTNRLGEGSPLILAASALLATGARHRDKPALIEWFPSQRWCVLLGLGLSIVQR